MNLGLVEMLRYNSWANETLFEPCRGWDYSDWAGYGVEVTS